MKPKTKFLLQPASSTSFIKPVLAGAGIGLVFIGLFLSGINNPDPSWPAYWQLRPLLIVPLAGAMGGLYFHFMGELRSRGGLIKAVAIVMSLIGFILILWLGTVLGLDGTLWD